MHKKVLTRLLLALCLTLAATVPMLAQPTVAVVNAASFKPNFPVSPGSWASAFGDFNSVGITTETQNTVLPVPTTLGGVQLFVNNVAAPLNYVGPGQVNFIVPAGTPEGKVALRITVSSLNTFEGFINVWPASPGIFIADTNNINKPGAILNEDNTPNDQAHPAQRGEVIQIFATGGDFTSFPDPSGAAASSDPLVTSNTTPKAYLSVAEGAVQFSGLTPGLAALWQINVVVPNQPYVSGQVPVFVEALGLNSNVVSIWVAE